MSLDQFKICSKIEPKLKKVVKAFHVFDDYWDLNVLFITSDDNVVNEPQVIPELCHKNIKQFFIGHRFVLALNSDGQIYGWGRNNLGQLATGSLGKENEYFKPKVISYFTDKTVIELSCGLNHTIAMTSDMFSKLIGFSNTYGFQTYG